MVDITVSGQVLSMEVDSGAGASVIAYESARELFPALELRQTNIVLDSISSSIEVCGELFVVVTIGTKSFNLSLIVAKNLKSVTPLLGRPWLDVIVANWREIFAPCLVVNKVSQVEVPTVKQLAALFPRPFTVYVDTPIEGHKACLVPKPNAIPVKHRAYKPAFGLVEHADKILDSWVDRDIAQRIRHADWASPAFLVRKRNGEYRLFVDLKKNFEPPVKN